jgi:hypothetical protein
VAVVGAGSAGFAAAMGRALAELSARAVIVASGATYPTADRPGWQEFGGRGVY